MAVSEVIARIGVVLGLDTAAFTTGSRKAQVEAATLQDKLVRVGKTIATAFLASEGLTVIAEQIKKGLEYAESLNEVAKQAGVTTTQLQEYRYVASQTGIDQETLTKGLSRLSITLGSLQDGAAKPTKALEELGFSTQQIGQISHLTAGDALPLLATAFSKIEDPAKKATLAAELFGARMGPKFLALLDEGGAHINELRDAAHRLGLVLSEKEIQNAEETSHKLSALKQVLSARIAAAVAENAQAIYHLADALTTLAEKALGAITAWGNFQRAVTGREDYLKRFDAAIDANPTLSSADREKAKAQGPAYYAARTGIAYKDVGGPSWARFKEVVDTGKESLLPHQHPRTLNDFLSLGLPTMPGGGTDGAAVKNLSKIADAHGTLADAAEHGARRVRAANDNVRKSYDETANAVAQLRDRLFPEEAAKRQYDADRALIVAQFKNADDRDAALLALGKEFATAHDKPLPNIEFDAEPLDQGVSSALKLLDHLGQKSEDTTVRVAKTFKDMADNVLSSLQKLTSGVKSGNFLDIIGGLLDLGLTLGGTGLFGKSIAASINRKIPGYATGIASAPGGLALVGERGPELVQLPRGSTVYPHGSGPQTAVQVQVLPSPYFAVAVDGRIAQAAPAIASAGASAAQSAIAFRGSRRLG